MAIERSIAKGDTELDNKDYLSAIESYTSAIKENPKAFKAYIKRATAYQRFKNYDRARTDISEAFALAQERGKREELGECYYRLGLIYYSEKLFKLALTNLKNAEKYGCKEPSISTWILKAEADVKREDPNYDLNKDMGAKQGNETTKNSGKDTVTSTSTSTNPSTNTSTSTSTNIDTINKHAPLKVKIRDDWYQTNEEAIITIYAKNVNADTLKISYNERSVSVSFPNGIGSEYSYNLDPLYSSIDPKQSSHVVKSTKIEITLVKIEKGKWPSLEGNSDNNESSREQPLEYPTSAKKSINWANFNVGDDDNDESQQNENDFFAKLFKDTDDDTRKAMMKSFTESNGTVLTTDWNDAKGKTFEPSPPEGMEAKKW